MRDFSLHPQLREVLTLPPNTSPDLATQLEAQFRAHDQLLGRGPDVPKAKPPMRPGRPWGDRWRMVAPLAPARPQLSLGRRGHPTWV